MLGRAILTMVLALLLPAAPAAAADEALWESLRGGSRVVLIRHAETNMEQRDEVGAPLADCSRQRNLTEGGREDSRLIGAVFRARGIPVGRVLSSAYCRCLETAQLAFGRVESWLALQQALTDRDVQAQRVAEIRALASEPPVGGNLILVSHQYPIRVLTGIQIGEGELLILTPKGGGVFDIAGRLPPEDLPSP
jgi:phosphohistidine phosphatase SixA